MRNNIILYVFILIFIQNSCDFIQNNCDFIQNNFIPGNNKNETKEDNSEIVIRKKKNSDGRIVTTIPYKGDVKHGIAKHYYPDGSVSQEIQYVNNIKHGFSKYYYTSGKLYRLTPYINGKIHGIRKKYYEDGKLMAEIPYRNGEVVPGLKEWTKDGKLLTQYPSIVFKEIDKLAFENKVILQISFSDNSKNIEFYRRYISANSDTNLIPLSVKDGKAELDFYIYKGNSIMEKIEIKGIKNTRRRNKWVVEKTYNLAVEHRLF